MFQLNIISYGGPFTARVSSTEYILDVIFLGVSLLLPLFLLVPVYTLDISSRSIPELRLRDRSPPAVR